MLRGKLDLIKKKFTTQRYDVQSFQVGKMFLSNIAKELDAIQDRKLNAKCVIFFHMVIQKYV